MTNKTSRRGFTLIEILVVIAISALLSSAAIVFNNTSRDQLALYSESAKVGQIISRAKSLSLATFDAPPSALFVCGYGLHIDYGANTYSVSRYESSDCFPITDIDDLSRADIETFSLSRGLVFGSGGAGDILFVPPDPTTYISVSGSLINSGVGNVTLLGSSGSSLGVSVNLAGQIDFGSPPTP